jgi:hypothetical protein
VDDAAVCWTVANGVDEIEALENSSVDSRLCCVDRFTIVGGAAANTGNII